jgi:hypothetical protein
MQPAALLCAAAARNSARHAHAHVHVVPAVQHAIDRWAAGSSWQYGLTSRRWLHDNSQHDENRCGICAMQIAADGACAASLALSNA